jgi:hypothetical protein
MDSPVSRFGSRSGKRLDDDHPGLINDIVTAVFSLERYLIRRLLLPIGVSLLGTVRGVELSGL